MEAIRSYFQYSSSSSCPISAKNCAATFTAVVLPYSIHTHTPSRRYWWLLYSALHEAVFSRPYVRTYVLYDVYVWVGGRAREYSISYRTNLLLWPNLPQIIPWHIWQKMLRGENLGTEKRTRNFLVWSGSFFCLPTKWEGGRNYPGIVPSSDAKVVLLLLFFYVSTELFTCS